MDQPVGQGQTGKAETQPLPIPTHWVEAMHEVHIVRKIRVRLV